MFHWRIAGVLIGLATCVSVAASPTPVASLTIQGDPVQSVGAPVVLNLLIRNTGAARMSYWCCGPGEYPDASDFVAMVARVGDQGLPQRIVLTNGQQPGASGRAMEVGPRRSVEFPVTIGLLLPGSYRITVFGARIDSASVVTWPATSTKKAFEVEVRHDNDLAASRDAQIIKRVRANDPFARYLAATWPRRAVREALVADVTGDDVVAADRAADGLWGDAEPAMVDGPLVARLILKHLQPPPDGCDIGLMTKLTRGSKPLESDDLKYAMAELAFSRPDGSIRQSAAAALARPNEPTVFGAHPTVDLAHVTNTKADQLKRHDSALLGAMLELARSADVHERKLAYRALAEFPASQAALDTIRTGLMDPDPGCQNVANTAMGIIVKRQATTQP
jgi:hypothetical protein